jgi:hypothetical protein
MIRIASIAALAAAGLVTPALADTAAPAANDTPSAQSFTAQLTAVAAQNEIRQLLAAQGYIVSSDLSRNDSGLWVGTALKNGKAVPVAIKMPPRTAPAVTN